MEFNDTRNNSAIVNHLVKHHQFKQRGNMLMKGTCPQCHRNHAATSVDNPHIIHCNYDKKCGETSKTAEHFPQLYPSLTERYEKQLATDPDAVAKGFLTEELGFDVSKLEGEFEQSWINNPEGKNPLGRSGVFAVRFPISDDVFYERYIESVQMRDEDGDMETRNERYIGKFKGLAFEPKGQKIEDYDKVYITKSILDALALYQKGYKSVSTLNPNHFSSKFFAQYQGKNIDWVYAFDNNQEGKKSTKIQIKKLSRMGETARCIFPYQEKTWYELYKDNQLETKNFIHFDHYGKLFLAKSATEKGNIIFSKNKKRFFVFDHNNEMFSFHLFGDAAQDFEKNKERIDEEEPELAADKKVHKALEDHNVVENIANCKVKLLYSQSNETGDEHLYFFHVKFPKGLVYTGTMTGNQIDTSKDFRKRLKSMVGGAMWYGDNNHMTWLMKGWMRDLLRVEAQIYAGYNKNINAYVYEDFAISNGQLYHKNSHDFIQIGKHNIKSIGHNVHIKANTNLSEYSDEWFDYAYRAFGTKFIVMLSFWVGTLFAEQIRKDHQSYPFLEAIGEPSSGKSTLVEFLFKLIGRESYEGFNPAKNKPANVARNMDSMSNMPVSFIEADNEEDIGKPSQFRRWSWEMLKDTYNGRSVRGRAIRSNDNRILEQPFKGAVLIVQNPAVSAELAIMQRIIHMLFDKSQHTKDSGEAAKLMINFPTEKCSGFLIKTLKKENKIMHLFNQKAHQYKDEMLETGGLNDVRIAKNHAQLLALLDTLKMVTPITEEQHHDAQEMIKEMAVDRQTQCSEDHPIIAEFWETVHYIEAIGEKEVRNGGVVMTKDYEQLENFEKIRHDDKEMLKINHHTQDGLIAINLKHYQKVARKDYGLDTPELSVLRKYLKNSKNPKFLSANQPVRSTLTHKSIRCWIFAARKEAA